jgi:lipoprotein-releasing system permease protein
MPNPERVRDLQREIEARGAKASNWQERNSSLFYALRMEKLAIGAVLATAALIASFSIVTVLVILLTQKRKDIGALMAMGLSRARTQAAFVGLGLILGMLGIGGGLVGGLVACFIIDRYPLPILPEIYYDSTIPATVDPALVAAVLGSAIAIAALSAWLPARAHARLEPAEALRARE